MERKINLDALAKEVSALNALLNDRHPELRSWKWLVEHQCITIVDLMLALHLLDEEVDEATDEA